MGKFALPEGPGLGLQVIDQELDRRQRHFAPPEKREAGWQGGRPAPAE
jgi:hypothetical protein